MKTFDGVMVICDKIDGITVISKLMRPPPQFICDLHLSKISIDICTINPDNYVPFE